MLQVGKYYLEGSEMQITVTQKHIDRGKRSQPLRCPITLAATEAGLFNPITSPGIIKWGLKNWGSYYATGLPIPSKAKLPFKARLFMWLFDRGWRVTPFTFHIYELGGKHEHSQVVA